MKKILYQVLKFIKHLKKTKNKTETHRSAIICEDNYFLDEDVCSQGLNPKGDEMYRGSV